jgi:hypothetical protein
MWLDCEIQLAGSPEDRQRRGVHVRVETLDGRTCTFPVNLASIDDYALEHFYAQPAWDIEGPADCFQTGPGRLHCDPHGLTTEGVLVQVTTLHECDPIRTLKVTFGQLTETSGIKQRLPA